MGRLLRAAITACFALSFSLTTASAAQGPPIVVRLGIHHFGRLSKPDAIVARASAKEVGFENTPGGPSNGPWSFDVGLDGTVWLLDQFDDRLLMWAPGRPDSVARTLRLPASVQVAADLALGPDRTIYLSYVPTHPSDARQRLQVLALTAKGRVRWTTDTDIQDFNSVLRVAGGILYWAPTPGTAGWTALTGKGGNPLNLNEQRASTLPSQPLGDGRSLEEVGVSQHETRMSLLDDAGAVITWWSVTSATRTYANGATPSVIGDDPVVPLIAQRPAGSGSTSTPETEYVVVRLAADGTVPAQVNLHYGATFGDSPVTPIRIGPHGLLFQLRSDPRTGVSVAAYSLGGVPVDQPGTGPGSAGPSDGSADPSASGSGSLLSRLVPWLAVAAMAVLVAAWLMRRRRHREKDEPPDPA